MSEYHGDSSPMADGDEDVIFVDYNSGGSLWGFLSAVVFAVLFSAGIAFWAQQQAQEREMLQTLKEEACETAGGEFSPSGLDSNTWCIVNGAPFIPDPKLWDPQLQATDN